VCNDSKPPSASQEMRAERERVEAEEKAREEEIDNARRAAEEEEAERIQAEQEAIRMKVSSDPIYPNEDVCCLHIYRSVSASTNT